MQRREPAAPAAALTRRTVLASAIGLALGAHGAGAATFTVTNTATSGAGSLSEAVAQANAAGGPDQIVFDPALVGSSFTPGGAIAVTDELVIAGPGRDDITLQGVSEAAMFEVADAAFTLSGLTLQKAAPFAGRFVALQGGGLTLADSTLDGAGITSPGDGGLIEAREADVVVERSTLTGATAQGDGGGIYARNFGGGEHAVTITDSTISGNTADAAADYDGGGLYVTTAVDAVEPTTTVTITNTTITDNHADNGAGGGVALYVGEGSRIDAVIDNSTLTANSAESGGGLSLPPTSQSGARGSIVIRDSNVSGNSAMFRGGGLELRTNNSNTQKQVEIVRTTVNDNTVTGIGGGIYAEASVSVPADPALTLVLRDSTVDNNRAGRGGGVALRGFGTAPLAATIDGCTLSRNDVNLEAYISFGNIDATVVNSTVSASTGTGVFLELQEAGSIDMDILHGTIADNDGAGIASNSVEASLTVVNSIVAGNAGGEITTPATVDFSLVGDGAGDAELGNITEPTAGSNVYDTEPLLGALADNGGPTLTHALMAGSPAIGAADVAATASIQDEPAHEQRGAPYPRLREGAPDMGAIESGSNRAPVRVADLDIEVDDAGEAVMLDLTDFYADPDGTSLTFTATGLPASLSLGADGMLSGNLSQADFDALPSTVTLTVSDGELELVETFTIDGDGGGGGSSGLALGVGWTWLLAALAAWRRRRVLRPSGG